MMITLSVNENDNVSASVVFVKGYCRNVFNQVLVFECTFCGSASPGYFLLVSHNVCMCLLFSVTIHLLHSTHEVGDLVKIS